MRHERLFGKTNFYKCNENLTIFLLKLYKTYVLYKCNENLTKSLLILYKEHTFDGEHMNNCSSVHRTYVLYEGTYVRQNNRGNTEHMFDIVIERTFGLHIVAAL